ncbi:MAG: ATP-binding protein [Alphaproteobacteria bacterium]
MTSLRSKITLGYYAIGMMVVVLAGLALFELRRIEIHVHGGERIAQLFDAVMEVRRFEKNLFLYGQPGDHDEVIRYLADSRRLATDNRPLLTGLVTDADIDHFLGGLDRYERMLIERTHLPATATDRQPLDLAIRAQGKDLVTEAEAMVRQQRTAMQRYLDHERHTLIVFGLVLALVVAVAGQILARAVAQPLGAIEHSIARMTEQGSHEVIPVPSRDSEIVSLTNAFNHLLRELEARRRELAFAEKLASLGTLISGVAHELNNPLSNISTSCQILAEDLEGDDVAFKREMLDQIADQTVRAQRIVQSLLEYSRHRNLEREAVPVGDLMRDSLALLKSRLPASVAITIAVPDGLAVSVDRHRMQQVFVNLLRNAADVLEVGGRIALTAHAVATPLATYLAETSVTFPGPRAPEGPFVEISVTDNGPGIDAQHIERIFDPFFTTKDVNHGTGLGLFVAYEVVRQHKGCIGVRSAPGEGTTFVVLLPEARQEVTA